MQKVRYGLIGSGSISRTHFDALARVPGTQVAAVASRSHSNAEMFAQWKGVPDAYDDYHRILEREDIDVVCVSFPNAYHAPIALEALSAGKHVVLEKPLCNTLAEADALIAAAAEHKRLLMYAEELCFVPRFVRLKQLHAEGAFGSPYMVRQIERHAGPYSDWFFTRSEAGGGAMVDLGCHSIETIRWLLDKPAVRSVYAQIDTVMHHERTQLDDHCIVQIEFEGNVLGVAEASWAKHGGMDSTLELFGDKGVGRAESFSNPGLDVFSIPGYGMLPDDARGWTRPVVDDVYEHGYVGEFEHFSACVRGDAQPLETAQDGREVLLIMLAAYHSARIGAKVQFPFDPPPCEFPVDLWRPPEE
ncbi:MAG: Gfo/Idh/MocA family oxidoreductase [Candidatus Alcyoniella australis]|nr:Gfo/Idh/MocA family oxidoreductase [Candidatus Alcyoniella australis]